MKEVRQLIRTSIDEIATLRLRSVQASSLLMTMTLLFLDSIIVEILG